MPTRWCARPSCSCTSGSPAAWCRRSRRAPSWTRRCPRRRSSGPRCGSSTRRTRPRPHVALLGHLPYTIMVSHCGAGTAATRSLAVTRWHSDGTRDVTGQFCYVKDVSSGRVWSAAHQPVCAPADWYHAFLATDRVTFHRSDGEIETRTEIAVVPEDSAEVRRVTVTNNCDDEREIELTSYGEIVLAPPEADRAHPAFGNLFVETEWHEWCQRDHRHPPPPLVPRAAALVRARGRQRARACGRGELRDRPGPLPRTGPLDPRSGSRSRRTGRSRARPARCSIRSLRSATRVRLDPGQSASVAFTTLVAHQPRPRVRAGRPLPRSARGPAGARSRLDLEPGGAARVPAHPGRCRRLPGAGRPSLLYGSAALRAPQSELRRNRGSQPLLWANGVSGDWPILLATIESAEGLPTLRQLLDGAPLLAPARDDGGPGGPQRASAEPTSRTWPTGSPPRCTPRATRPRSTSPAACSSGARTCSRPDELLMLRATARVHIPCDGRALGTHPRDGDAGGAAG